MLYILHTRLITVLNTKSIMMHIRTAILLGFCIILNWSTACFLAKANVNGILITCNKSINNALICTMSDVASIEKLNTDLK